MVMISKSLSALFLLNFSSLTIQLLPVISVPITNPSRYLYLSNFNNYTYGVFGVCDKHSGFCSEPRIGYPSVNSTFYLLANDEGFNVGGVELPSKAVYTISKLLIVHVIALCFSGLLFVTVLGLIIFRNLKDVTMYYNLMLTFALISFVCTLLAFLSDILLFIPNLSYLGWLQLFPIVSLTLIAAMLCFVKRTVSSRKYIEDDPQFKNNDMRMRKLDSSRWTHDDASDDGFYVFTNGFYSTQQPRASSSSQPHLFRSHSNVHSSFRNYSEDDASMTSSDHDTAHQNNHYAHDDENSLNDDHIDRANLLHDNNNAPSPQELRSQL